jgi:hypothetical protein
VSLRKKRTALRLRRSSVPRSRPTFETRDGIPVIVIDPEIDLFDDKAAKPAAIAKYIGRQPIACFGNSDGDREMLQWTSRGIGVDAPRLGLIVHHTDAEREFGI